MGTEQKKKKATWLAILDFIWASELVGPSDLVEKFGYTAIGASTMLNWLKGQGLVINERRGEWTVTDRGLRTLIYYGRVKV